MTEITTYESGISATHTPDDLLTVVDGMLCRITNIEYNDKGERILEGLVPVKWLPKNNLV